MSAQSHYRPDIDGLRSIAVIPVVLFHAGLSGFPGGYVGVDVFFVISGFLITGILLREMNSQRYSVAEFYRRRARRIFPALAAMTLATLAAGMVFLPPDELVKVSKSAASLVVFASNFYFWKSVSYFDASHAFQPLLHTWSLAVEEQYYVLFPIVPWLLLNKKRLFVPALWAIGIVSLVLSIYLVSTKPSAAFYLLPSRAWELMAGGLLAANAVPGPRNVRRAAFGSWLGLAMIVIPMLSYTTVTPFPGIAAVPPVLGTSLIIWACGVGAGRLLTHRVFVSVGLASYSLYLWHLPIIEFLKYLYGGKLSLGPALTASLASVAVAYLSLNFVEKPFRVSDSKDQAARNAHWAFALLPLIAAASLAIVLFQGIPQRLSPELAQAVDVAKDETRHPKACLSVDTNWVDPARPCRLGSPSAAPSVLLWGDSHSMVTATAMVKAAKRANASFLFAADADCPIGKDLGIAPDPGSNITGQLSYRRCGDYNAGMLRAALNSNIHTVVLSSRWTNWRIGEPSNLAEGPLDLRLSDATGDATSLQDNARMFERALTSLVLALTKAQKEIVIVGPLPEPGFNVPQRLFVSRFGLTERIQPMSYASYVKRHQVILAIFARLPKSPKIHFVWPANLLCDETGCPVTRRGRPLYFDHNHLSVEAAESTSPLYESIFAATAVRAGSSAATP